MFRLIAAKYWPEISSDAAPLMIPLRLFSVTGALLESSRRRTDLPVTWPCVARLIFGRSRGQRLTIPMAVRPWCEPSSRLRATAFRKPIFQRRRNPAIGFAASPAMGPAKAQSRRSARPTQSFPALDASLCAHHEASHARARYAVMRDAAMAAFHRRWRRE